MKIAILILMVAVCASAALTSADYKHKYRPVYNGQVELSDYQIEVMYKEFLHSFKGKDSSIDDYSQRFTIFKNKLAEIIKHNQDSTQSWKKGINEFSDMTDEEFFAYYRINDMAAQECSATASKGDYSYSSGSIAVEFDWRTYNKVTPVKSQGSCGSCWTFSTVGALEAHAHIAANLNVTQNLHANFSEQQLVDCAGSYDCHGCKGGLPSYAFTYLSDVGGLEQDSDYPYHAVDETCVFDKSKVTVTTDGSFNITAGDEFELHRALYEKGPVSVAFQVVGDFRDYESGVYTSTNCKNTKDDVNHAVLAVGYGFNMDQGKAFYSIKNSWGASWGNNGYFDMEAYVNMCGVAVCNSYPLNVQWKGAQTKNSLKGFMNAQ